MSKELAAGKKEVKAEPGWTFEQAAKMASNEADFWRTCALHLSETLASLARGGREKDGGRLQSQRALMRRAREATNEFREIVVREFAEAMARGTASVHVDVDGSIRERAAEEADTGVSPVTAAKTEAATA